MFSIFGNLLKRKRSAPNPFDVFYGQATDALASQDLRLAIQLYDRAIALDPTHAMAYYKRGNALKDLGRLDAAIRSYDQAIERRSDYAHAYCNRGVVQHSLGLMGAALLSYDQAIAADATDAMAHYNRALLMQDCSRWDAALADYNQAISIDPGFADAQYNRSLALLFKGDFENGWRGYEWRWKNAQRLSIGIPRNFRQPLWLGEVPLAGKRLLLYCEGGLGDTLQFCRYAPLSAAQGATVILEVQPPLLGLIADIGDVSQVVAAGDPLPSFDYQCPLMSLPLAFKTTLDTVPTAPRYLHSDQSKVARWRTLLGERSRPRVGLVWSGNPDNKVDARRSIRLSDWIPHLPPEFEYFCLQKDVRDADRAALESSRCIVSFDDNLLNFENTAALCDCLDITISVDTSIAHLSCALGRPTWVLLPFTPDWRWLLDRDDSPWYPTAKLFRQKAVDDWNEVFSRVAGDLRREFAMSTPST
jgi:hypothetical protein